MHNDFLGQEIKEGDRVISYNSSAYAGLRWGTVEKLTPKMVRIKFGNRTQTRYSQDLVVMSMDQEQSLAFAKLSGEHK
jgi:hypothetical protein